MGLELAATAVSGMQPAGPPTPDGRVIDGTWSRVRFDIILAPTGV